MGTGHNYALMSCYWANHHVMQER